MASFAKGEKQAAAHRSLPFLFHFAGFILFISSTAVAGVMFFFLHHLREKSFAVPWMYFFLQSAALLSLIWLVVSRPLRCFHKLSPAVDATVNGFITTIWIVAFSLLAYRMRWIVVRKCTTAMWANSQGVLICRLYKILYSSAVVGVLSSIATVIIDVTILRCRDGLGKYVRTGSELETSVKTLRYGKGPTTESVELLHTAEVPRVVN